jgi:hypothetical protein
MPDNQGFGLIDASRSTLIDSVGFVGNGGSLPYIEGAGLRTTLGARPNIEHAWVRKIDPTTSLPIDTDNNLSDFQLVSVTAAAFTTSTTPIQSFLGAPGPENASAPVTGFSVDVGLVDPGCAQAGPLTSGCMLARDPTPIDANSTLGTISIRRKITNNTGASITKLRFRMTDDSTTTLPVPPGSADLRLRTSSAFTANLSGGGTTPVQGLSLENPPAQASGGGSNSATNADTVTLATPLAPGASMNIAIDFGVNQLGTFRVGFIMEALPLGGAQFFAGGLITAPTAADGNVSGAITDGSGNPLPGVVVNLSGPQSRRTITDANGNYRFRNVAAGGQYTVTPALANYHFSPADRSFPLVTDKTDAVFTGTVDATASANAIDTNEYFVRQQYLDFLGREPDQEGLTFWAGKLNACNADAACLHTGRIDVSAAFFQSQEFYDTGSFVYRLYRGALGRRLSYTEFASDRSHVVGGPNLEASKRAFALEFVTRSEFAQRYQQNNGADFFVDALLQTLQQETGVDLNSQRITLVARYQDGSTATESRALVVRDLIDQQAFAQAVYNASFVEMEYMGYLRRGGERTGYDFWVNVLNNSDPGNYRGMVCSFITSTEYQHRFSSVVSHSNAECGP